MDTIQNANTVSIDDTISPRSSVIFDDGFVRPNTIGRKFLTKDEQKHLSHGHAEIVGEFTHYFMHVYCSRSSNFNKFVREREERARTPRKAIRKNKVKMPKLDAEDWSELEVFSPIERIAIYEEILQEPWTALRRKQLKSRIAEMAYLAREWRNTVQDYFVEEGIELVSEIEDSFVPDLTTECVESNPGPFDNEQQEAKNKGLFHQRNMMCALNEFVQKSHRATMVIKVDRIGQTPDHDPRYLVEIQVLMDHVSYSAQAIGRNKVEAKEICAKRVFEFVLAGEEHYLSVLPSGHWIRDLLRENIEANPGPNQSKFEKNQDHPKGTRTPHPSFTRNNEPRVVVLERALRREQEKIRGLEREIRRLAKNKPQAQMFGIDTINELSARLRQLPDKSQWSDVTSDIHRVTHFLDTMLPVLQANLSQSSVYVVDKLTTIKEDLIKIIVLVLLVKLFMKFEQHRIAICMVLLFVVYQYGMPEEISQMVCKLRSLVMRPRAEAAEDVVYSEHFSLCGRILFACLALICVKAMPGKKDWDNFVLRLDRIPKAVTGVTKICDFTDQYWQIAYEQVKMMVLGKTRTELREVYGVMEEIKNWSGEVQRYLELRERDKIDTNPETAAQVEQLWRQGLRFKEENLSREADRIVSSHLGPAKALFEYVSASPVKGSGPRMRPVCVWLCGESGIGKTEMVYPLCIDILTTMGLTKDHDFHHQVYARQVETEFWDGYKDQKVVIYDDAFQQKDDRVNGNPELFEVIRSCNTFPQHLHMAALHDKNTYSCAEVLLYTTNEMNVEINSLSFPEAFKNRMFDNAYVVRPKKEYARVLKLDSGKEKLLLDHSKLGDVAINLDVYEFQKKNSEMQDVGEPIDYVTFSTMICKQWKSEKAKSQQKLEFLKNYVGRARAQMAEMDEFVDAPFDFCGDISTRVCAGEELCAIEASYALDHVMWQHYCEFKYHNKTQVKYTLLDKLKRIVEEFSAGMKVLKDEALKLIREHPILSVVGFIGVALTLVSYFSSEELPAVEMAVSGDNKTNRTQRATIEGWSNPTPLERRAYLKEQNGLLQSCFVKIAERNQWGCFDPKYDAQSEHASSGDSKTIRMVRPRIENALPYERCNWCGDTSVADNFSGPDWCSTCEQQKEQDLKAMEGGPVVQGCSDPSALYLIQDLVKKNTYHMVCRYGDREDRLGNVLFLKGWTIAFPFHYVWAMANRKMWDGEIILTQDGKTDLIKFPVKHLITPTGNTENIVRLDAREDQDCVVACLHRTMCQPHRDIMRHIVTQEDLSSIRGNLRGTMMTYHRENETFLPLYHTLIDIKACDKEKEIDLNSQYHHKQRTYYTYLAPTSNGDCGAPIVLFSKRMERKIIGIHIAGDAAMNAYACPWTFERLQKCIDCLAKYNVAAQFCYDVDDLTDTTVNPKMPEGGFVPVGKCKLRLGQAVKTAIKPSKLYGVLRPVLTRPAALTSVVVNGEVVDPLLKGLKKCGVIPVLLDSDDIYACMNDVKQNVCFNHRNIDLPFYQRVLSYSEAVQGCNDDFMRAVNRSTSPGFPYAMQRNGKAGKTRWLGHDEFFDFDSMDARQMQEDVFALLKDCENGIIRGVYCSDTKKDERREHTKVLEGKTRVFSACPIHFVIAFRMYFLGFSAWIMHNRNSNEVSVGTNPYSLDWQNICVKLQEKGEHVIAGDFSNFDGSLNAQVLWSILDLVNDWYDDGELNKKIRTCLWAHVVHSTHIFDDNVYMWTHSQPSGNPFTVIINSLYNSIIMRMAWIECMRPLGKANMCHFNNFVSMVSYGDDNVLNISGRVLEHYNQETIAKALAKLGHTYTDETKTGEMVKSRKLRDVMFLKRAFVYSEELQRWIAPLKEEVVYEMISWVRNTVDPDEILQANIETAAREMVLHGRHKFETFVSEIGNVRNRLRILPKISTYQEYLYDLKTNPDIWFD